MKKRNNNRMKKAIKDFFEVTPKEWVAVQVFCAGVVTALTTMWETLANVFGSEDSDTAKTVMKIVLGVCAFLAAYAQTKTKKR